MTTTHPNFFLLLGLNPDAAWNQTLFEETLRKKRNEWSHQGAGVAKKALLAKQNLALIPKITEVMTNPDLREAEALAARKELAAEQQREREQFEKQLAFINAKDTLDKEEIENFVAAFQHLLPAAEIARRIQVPTPTSEADAAQAHATLEESIAKNIADRLQIIHMSTLYELLQLPDKTSTAELLRAAAALYARLVRLQPTAETIAKMELTGLARYAFKNDEARTSYDETLRQNSLQRTFYELDASMSRTKHKQVHARQVVLFLNDAQKDGWSEQDALARLKEHIQQKKWSMAPAFTAEQEKLTWLDCEHLDKKKAAGVHMITLMGTSTTLTYQIMQPTLLRKQRMLHIIVDLPGERGQSTSLPPLQLISKHGQIPLRRTDGELFYRIEGIEGMMATRREVMLPLPEKNVPQKTYGKLFLEDDTLYTTFLIHHPSHTRMKLG